MIGDIISGLMNDKKLQGTRSLLEKIYRDEPIFRPASELDRPAPTPDRRAQTPDKIAQMKRILYSNATRWHSHDWLFCEQGKFMADFEDSFDRVVDMKRYYPAYCDMTTDELRTYFTWRTKVRKGEYPPISLSYIFLYIYEVINGIGIDLPEEGYYILETIGEKYGETKPSLMQYLDRWIVDYVVYYSLDAQRLKSSPQIVFDNTLITLIHCNERSDDEVFYALRVLSSYNIDRSPLYKAYPDDFKAVAVGMYRSLSDFCAAHRKNTLVERYFGAKTEQRSCMFRGAIFYEQPQGYDRKVELNEIHSYEYKGGKWSCTCYLSTGKKNKKLGELMKKVDFMLRQRLEFKHKLSDPGVTKQDERMITKEIDRWLEEKKKREAARVDIDMSALESIRRTSEVTREKLLVDEEPEPVSAEPEIEEAAENDTPLDSAEFAFLRALLYGGDWAQAAREANSMPSLLADSINEKLFDTFSDTVIEFDGDTPVLIEDYIEDLKGMITQ